MSSGEIKTSAADELPSETGDETLSVSAVVAAARWLSGSTIRRHPLKMLAIVAAQVFGAIGTAVGTLAVIFYIRAAIGDGTLGRIDIRIESAAEPSTAAVFLLSLIAVISGAALAIWLSEREIAELALEHASRLRSMIVELITDPLSQNWFGTIDHNRPAMGLHQTMVSRVRSATVALTELLALGPSLVILVLSLGVMVIIDPIATLLALPVAALFGVIGERVNREVQELTALYDARQVTSRELLLDQIDDLSEGIIGGDELSFSRTVSDDRLFHKRQLANTKLRLLSLVNSAFIFALIVAYFVIVRGVDTLSIEIIIAYTFAVRFAAQAVQQIIKALAQVSRRFEDIEVVSQFLARIDEHRIANLDRDVASEIPTEIELGAIGSYIPTVNMSKPALILSSQPVDERHALSLLEAVEGAANDPDLDLVSRARVFEVEPENPVPDMLATEPVRVIITDDPIPVLQERRRAYTFIAHNRPRLVLGARVRAADEQFGCVLVIKDGKIAWAGSVQDAATAQDHIRQLVRRGRKQRTQVGSITSGDVI